jgi:hypothetical protein
MSVQVWCGIVADWTSSMKGAPTSQNCKPNSLLAGKTDSRINQGEGISQKTQSAAYQVFEISNGALGQLCARLTKFDEAVIIAAAKEKQSRVIVHMGQIIWLPKS